jgi:tetratricopeptide (TPR) repeat protein
MALGTVQPRDLVLVVLTLAVLAGGLGLVLAPRRRGPDLDAIGPLLEARRFDDVERRLRDYLELHPDSPQANMLMAQAALARPDQKPRLALEHLARVRVGDRSVTAIVRLNEGKAYSALARYDRAEAAWLEARRLDPLVPEAGWALLGLYYVEGRRDAAHRLALALHAAEPDSRDRVQLLLELVRQDAQPLGADSIIRVLEPAHRAHPDDDQTARALGRALVRAGRADEGLTLLRRQAGRHPDDFEAWDALLTGLDQADRHGEMASVLARLPVSCRDDPRLDRFRGRLAQEARDWPAAADAYLRAWRADPSRPELIYRLSHALRLAGRDREFDRFEPRARALIAARERILGLYEEASAVPRLGTAPHTELYHRLAELREHMGRFDEARAWQRLVLRDRPDDPVSLAALERLADPEREGLTGGNEGNEGRKEKSIRP